MRARRWPFAKGEAEQPREIEGLSIEPTTEIHRSPGLQAALSHLSEDRPCNILDLGPAVAGNIDFFSRYPCRLHIVDLLGRLADEPESAVRLELAPGAFFDELLSIELDHFDLVLAWTVFDNLEKGAARRLASHLARLTHEGARLFAIVATGHGAGAGGLDFTICGHDTLEYRATGRPDHRSAPLKPAAFSKQLAGFAIDESVVLRHGFQEYVAVRLGDQHEEAPDAERPDGTP
ncbi:MAG: hypothetical protein ABFS37_02130 [Acidobacteriota bacterium]